MKNIIKIIKNVAKEAKEETQDYIEKDFTQDINWPVNCTIGPGLEGAIACVSKVGYVNGTIGRLIYRGYDVFDLCLHSSFEEVSYLLLYGHLPSRNEFKIYKEKLIHYRFSHETLRSLMSFKIEKMNPMAAMRLGTLLMRQKSTYRDLDDKRPSISTAIYTDEDSIPMETVPQGHKHAAFEFKQKQKKKLLKNIYDSGADFETCHRLVSALATLAAAIHRIRLGKMPIEPDPGLSHAANLLYMINGVKPTQEEEKIMDIALILHADHGMNASTFASLLIASTLSDVYFSVGAGIAALNGPLHGGANEKVIKTLKELSTKKDISSWVTSMLAKKKKIMGFGHRVYKTYDPRARMLGPLAKYLSSFNEENVLLYKTAETLEKTVISKLSKKKKIFPNVDFYSGLVYKCLGIPPYLYTPLFSISRVSGWTARIMEYLKTNRIFRPRALYNGEFNKEYKTLDDR